MYPSSLLTLHGSWIKLLHLVAPWKHSLWELYSQSDHCPKKSPPHQEMWPDSLLWNRLVTEILREYRPTSWRQQMLVYLLLGILYRHRMPLTPCSSDWQLPAWSLQLPWGENSNQKDAEISFCQGLQTTRYIWKVSMMIHEWAFRRSAGGFTKFFLTLH